MADLVRPFLDDLVTYSPYISAILAGLLVAFVYVLRGGGGGVGGSSRGLGDDVDVAAVAEAAADGRAQHPAIGRLLARLESKPEDARATAEGFRALHTAAILLYNARAGAGEEEAGGEAPPPPPPPPSAAASRAFAARVAPLVHSALVAHGSDAAVVRGAFSLLSALHTTAAAAAADEGGGDGGELAGDGVGASVLRPGALTAITSALRRHVDDAVAAAYGCQCVGIVVDAAEKAVEDAEAEAEARRQEEEEEETKGDERTEGDGESPGGAAAQPAAETPVLLATAALSEAAVAVLVCLERYAPAPGSRPSGDDDATPEGAAGGGAGDTGGIGPADVGLWALYALIQLAGTDLSGWDRPAEDGATATVTATTPLSPPSASSSICNTIVEGGGVELVLRFVARWPADTRLVPVAFGLLNVLGNREPLRTWLRLLDADGVDVVRAALKAQPHNARVSEFATLLLDAEAEIRATVRSGREGRETAAEEEEEGEEGEDRGAAASNPVLANAAEGEEAREEETASPSSGAVRRRRKRQD
jgi:hypothetical protein